MNCGTVRQLRSSSLKPNSSMGVRSAAPWTPRAELESTVPELRQALERVLLCCLGWCEREGGERGPQYFSSTTFHHQDQSRNLKSGVTCIPPSICQVFFLKYKFIYFIYLFLAALGLCCCARAFSSCSTACGIFLDQGSNPCPLHWQVDS